MQTGSAEAVRAVLGPPAGLAAIFGAYFQVVRRNARLRGDCEADGYGGVADVAREVDDMPAAGRPAAHRPV